MTTFQEVTLNSCPNKLSKWRSTSPRSEYLTTTKLSVTQSDTWAFLVGNHSTKRTLLVQHVNLDTFFKCGWQFISVTRHISLSWGFTLCNTKLHQYLCYTKDKMLGKSIWSLVFLYICFSKGLGVVVFFLYWKKLLLVFVVYILFLFVTNWNFILYLYRTHF